MFTIFPDVVFGKGGFGSLPALIAARLWKIPIVIHESDSVPGRVNKWAGKFADRIAVSYPEAAEYFPKSRVAWTGQPVRLSIKPRPKEEAEKFLQLEPGVPVMLVIGGSLGAERINDVILESLPSLLLDWQIIHQTGRANLKEAIDQAGVVMNGKKFINRYHPFDFLSDSALAMASGAADLVVSRAGSSIFEIASWGLPSIIIPINESNGDHQRQNAFEYMKSGAAIVIEEQNLSDSVLVADANRLRTDNALRQSMILAAEKFNQPDAALRIAKALVQICIDHEPK
jgi:UDP-N-acetylglucosamine--N-acetylmuramyl-(pentapeptide) pyrophosphoryl-undecaprenol N-acetylglucosamine transferase